MAEGLGGIRHRRSVPMTQGKCGFILFLARATTLWRCSLSTLDHAWGVALSTVTGVKTVLPGCLGVNPEQCFASGGTYLCTRITIKVCSIDPGTLRDRGTYSVLRLSLYQSRTAPSFCQFLHCPREDLTMVWSTHLTIIIRRCLDAI